MFSRLIYPIWSPFARPIRIGQSTERKENVRCQLSVVRSKKIFSAISPMVFSATQLNRIKKEKDDAEENERLR